MTGKLTDRRAFLKTAGAVAAGRQQFVLVDEQDQSLHCLFCGVLEDHFPSGIFSGLRVEHDLEVGSSHGQEAAVRLNERSHTACCPPAQFSSYVRIIQTKS